MPGFTHEQHAGLPRRRDAREGHRTRPEAPRKSTSTSERRRSPRVWLLAVRVGLPVAMVIGGIVLLATGPLPVGFALIVVAVLAVYTNLFVRLSISSNLDREREQHAREIFRRTGRWPEER